MYLGAKRRHINSLPFLSFTTTDTTTTTIVVSDIATFLLKRDVKL